MKTEARIMQECNMYFNNTYPQLRGLYFEISNNAFSARSGMFHKAIGRQAGVADACFLSINGAVFFEFKTVSGKQSEVQKKWQQLIEKHNYKYYIIRNLEEFKKQILNLVPSAEVA